MNRRELLKATMAGGVMLQRGRKAFAAPPESIQVTIDASKAGAPVNPMIFGGYMEPATTRVWAEMLGDRKFANAVVPAAPAASGGRGGPGGGMARRFGGDPFRPVGPAEGVEMDTVRPFVGAHSPRIKLAGSEARGIQASGLRVGKGKTYTGRVWLAGDHSAKVLIRLVWGEGPNDSQTITAPPLTSVYQKVPLKFTVPADSQTARLEIVGAGSGGFHIGTASLMPADNVQGFHAGMIRCFKEQGFKMAKWSGGNFVSGYDWYDGLGDVDKRPPRFQAMWGGRVEPNDVGIHEFIAFCRLLGAEPDLAINSGFGEARVAAEEVEYCNGSTDTRLGKLRAQNGHPEPFNVRCWTIGNEMYGPWQFGYMSLNQYWVKHNYIVEAMKKVDPKIKVTLAGASICETSWCAAEQNQSGRSDMWRPPLLEKLPFQFGGHEDWDGWLLQNCTDNIDFVSEHTYSYPGLFFDAEKQHFVDAHDPLPMQARRASNRIGAAFEAWQKYVEKMPNLKQRGIKFIFDEWGCRYRNAQGGAVQPPGMLTTLSYAMVLNEIFRHSDMVEASCATGGLGTVQIDSTGEATGYSAEGLVLKLMQTHFGGALPVALTGNSPQQPVDGTPFVDKPNVPIGSPTYPLDVLAAFSGDRKKLLISVVNPTEEGHEFTPRITGVKLRVPGKVSQIAPPSVNSANQAGQKPVVEITEHPQQAFTGAVRVPPVSINVYEFEIETA